MKYLTYLNISNNKFTKLDIVNSPDLQYLDASGNQITNIGDLSNYRYLQYLCLDKNLILKISGISQCLYISHLSLRHNGITKIEGLENLKMLKSLDLRQNRIKEIEGIDNCLDLEQLYLSNNFIISFKNLEKLSSLMELDVENNEVGDHEEFQYLSSLTYLRHLNIKKNPIENVNSKSVSSSSFRYLVIYLLPMLRILNGIPISSEEKVAAINANSPTSHIVSALSHNHDVISQIKQFIRIKANDLTLSTRLKPIVIAGNAGAGKRTLTQRLLKELPQYFGLCVSHTTRPPKQGEEDGVHYHFTSKAEMTTMMEGGQFVEVVSFFGNWYGNSFDSIYKVALEGKICIMDLEMEGVLSLKKSTINSRYVYITAPSYSVLQTRLEHRNATQKKLQQLAEEKIWKEMEEKKQEKYKNLINAHIRKKSKELEAAQANISYGVINVANISQLSEDTELKASPSKRFERDEKDDTEGEIIVAQWMKKAQAENETIKGSRHESLYETYHKEPGFFDITILNDDFETAYQQLKKFALESYWKCFEDD